MALARLGENSLVDSEDVRQAILDEGLGNYAAWEFADDVEFQDWMDRIIERVVLDFTPRVAHFTLDNRNHFWATVYESISRMWSRGVTLGWSSYQGAEQLSVGPFSIQPSRRSVSTVTGLQDVRDLYHRMAESKLVAGGAQGRQGAVRVWRPACTTRII